MASVCTATRTMPVAADIMEHFARIETIFQCIKRKTIFRLTQNTKQVKHLLIVGPSIVACHAANNCVIAARIHGCSCCNKAFGGFPRASGSDSSCLRRLILPACRPLRANGAAQLHQRFSTGQKTLGESAEGGEGKALTELRLQPTF